MFFPEGDVLPSSYSYAHFTIICDTQWYYFIYICLYLCIHSLSVNFKWRLRFEFTISDQFDLELHDELDNLHQVIHFEIL